mgnify:CR=1 FL=1
MAAAMTAPLGMRGRWMNQISPCKLKTSKIQQPTPRIKLLEAAAALIALLAMLLSMHFDIRTVSVHAQGKSGRFEFNH